MAAEGRFRTDCSSPRNRSGKSDGLSLRSWCRRSRLCSQLRCYWRPFRERGRLGLRAGGGRGRGIGAVVGHPVGRGGRVFC